MADLPKLQVTPLSNVVNSIKQQHMGFKSFYRAKTLNQEFNISKPAAKLLNNTPAGGVQELLF